MRVLSVGFNERWFQQLLCVKPAVAFCEHLQREVHLYVLYREDTACIMLFRYVAL